MNGQLLQDYINKGYRRAAERIGDTYSQYRPQNANVVITPSNLLTSNFLATFTPDFKFMAPREHGSFKELMLADIDLIKAGDYFVGPVRTYFVPAIQPFVSLYAIYCNESITISRATDATNYGNVQYSEITQSNLIPLYTGWPVSLLLRPRRSKNPVDLPTDMPNGEVMILMPAFFNMPNLLIGDIIMDSHGIRYAVQIAEITDLGWRMLANIEVS